MRSFLFFKILGLTLIFVSAVAEVTVAQRYATSVGLRFGNNDVSRMVGVTAKQRIMQQLTVEGIIQSDFNKNTTAHILMANHRPIISKRFNYYYGAGFSFGREESFVKQRETKEIVHTYGNATMGMDLIAGLELTVANTVISLDYKPNVNLAGREEFFRGQVGISARTVLVKSKEQDRKWRKKKRAKKRAAREPFGDKLKNTFNFRSN
ncbi:hypothetical protein [Cecembia lonarensis]|uniref:Outer membrane protein beta-barrel domain-containing protein n=1 Tax=Cecembia lonarensis (strain CCUG 58316 / KCTC 22772 / LW9) TaxID=1225176 RepID=K1L849_CECL9|nr:hypothetical protein [Cecembia lonarensis]EKB50871.1 hypothetical protein B879_00399 [Cecembia lonarensis LW9]